MKLLVGYVLLSVALNIMFKLFYLGRGKYPRTGSTDSITDAIGVVISIVLLVIAYRAGIQANLF